MQINRTNYIGKSLSERLNSFGIEQKIFIGLYSFSYDSYVDFWFIELPY